MHRLAINASAHVNGTCNSSYPPSSPELSDTYSGSSTDLSTTWPSQPTWTAASSVISPTTLSPSPLYDSHPSTFLIVQARSCNDSITRTSATDGAGAEQTTHTSTHHAPLTSPNQLSIPTTSSQTTHSTPRLWTHESLQHQHNTNTNIHPHAHAHAPSISPAILVGIGLGALLLMASLVALGFFLGRRRRAVQIHFQEAKREHQRASSLVWFRRATSRLSGMLLGSAAEECRDGRTPTPGALM